MRLSKKREKSVRLRLQGPNDGLSLTIYETSREEMAALIGDISASGGVNPLKGILRTAVTIREAMGRHWVGHSTTISIYGMSPQEIKSLILQKIGAEVQGNGHNPHQDQSGNGA